MWTALIVVWLVVSVLVAFLAVALGRGPGIWFLVSLLLSPAGALAALLIVWEVQRLGVEQRTPSVTPELAFDELLPRLERLFDQGKLTSQQWERVRTLAQREPTHTKAKPVAPSSADEFTRPCPSCGRLISPKAATCMHCFAKVVAQGA